MMFKSDKINAYMRMSGGVFTMKPSPDATKGLNKLCHLFDLTILTVNPLTLKCYHVSMTVNCKAKNHKFTVTLLDHPMFYC